MRLEISLAMNQLITRAKIQTLRFTKSCVVVGLISIFNAASAAPPPKIVEEKEIAPVLEAELLFKNPLVEDDSEIDIDGVRKVMELELMFVRHVCELPPARRPAFRERANEIVDEVFKAVNKPGTKSEVLDLKTRLLIQKKFLVEIQKISKEQGAIYDQELKSRMMNVKEATILGLTALLDQELSLTAEQRDTLASALSTKWKEEWEHWLLVANQEETNVPSFADKIVSRIITPAQKQVWRTIPKLDLSELQFDEVFLEIAEIPEDDELNEENENYWLNPKS